MADTFGKFKDTFNKGIASIGAKASNNVEKSKLKNQLEAYNKEAEAMITELGRKAYGMWNSGNEDYSALVPQYEAIKAKFDAIQATFNELKAIEERERLANQPAPTPVYAQPQPGMNNVYSGQYAQPVQQGAPVYATPVQPVAPVVPTPAPVAAPIVEPVTPVVAPVIPEPVPVTPVAPVVAPVVEPVAPIIPVAAPVEPVVPVAQPVSVPVVVPVEPVAPVAPVVPAPMPVAAPVEPVAPVQQSSGCTCPNCGAHFETEINFCRMCGTKIKQ